ncbi:hypothetical protein [Celeribacter ethanolicus]|uniref:hypothetical protein n=1 Tax=Celeribacter ethanolicus TaxID=1758178 RepID=UPI0012DCE292|nr:hypothetical protein [Celeribacter ethanolicus]
MRRADQGRLAPDFRFLFIELGNNLNDRFCVWRFVELVFVCEISSGIRRRRVWRLAAVISSKTSVALTASSGIERIPLLLHLIANAQNIRARREAKLAAEGFLNLFKGVPARQRSKGLVPISRAVAQIENLLRYDADAFCKRLHLL